MIIVLNGPLGIGKSTLAEALTESIDGCVMLDGDHLIAANPPPADEVGYLHATLAVLVGHHRRSGYRHFVIDHPWRTPEALHDLRRALGDADPDAQIRCFLLTLPVEENPSQNRASPGCTRSRRAGVRAADRRGRAGSPVRSGQWRSWRALRRLGTT